jgi:hypothetical protein
MLSFVFEGHEASHMLSEDLRGKANSGDGGVFCLDCAAVAVRLGALTRVRLRAMLLSLTSLAESGAGLDRLVAASSRAVVPLILGALDHASDEETCGVAMDLLEAVAVSLPTCSRDSATGAFLQRGVVRGLPGASWHVLAVGVLLQAGVGALGSSSIHRHSSFLSFVRMIISHAMERCISVDMLNSIIYVSMECLRSLKGEVLSPQPGGAQMDPFVHLLAVLPRLMTSSLCSESAALQLNFAAYLLVACKYCVNASQQKPGWCRLVDDPTDWTCVPHPLVELFSGDRRLSLPNLLKPLLQSSMAETRGAAAHIVNWFASTAPSSCQFFVEEGISDFLSDGMRMSNGGVSAEPFLTALLSLALGSGLRFFRAEFYPAQVRRSLLLHILRDPTGPATTWWAAALELVILSLRFVPPTRQDSSFLEEVVISLCGGGSSSTDPCWRASRLDAMARFVTAVNDSAEEGLASVGSAFWQKLDIVLEWIADGTESPGDGDGSISSSEAQVLRSAARLLWTTARAERGGGLLPEEDATQLTQTMFLVQQVFSRRILSHFSGISSTQKLPACLHFAGSLAAVLSLSCRSEASSSQDYCNAILREFIGRNGISWLLDVYAAQERSDAPGGAASECLGVILELTARGNCILEGAGGSITAASFQSTLQSCLVSWLPCASTFDAHVLSLLRRQSPTRHLSAISLTLACTSPTLSPFSSDESCASLIMTSCSSPGEALLALRLTGRMSEVSGGHFTTKCASSLVSRFCVSELLEHEGLTAGAGVQLIKTGLPSFIRAWLCRQSPMMLADLQELDGFNVASDGMVLATQALSLLGVGIRTPPPFDPELPEGAAAAAAGWLEDENLLVLGHRSCGSAAILDAICFAISDLTGKSPAPGSSSGPNTIYPLLSRLLVLMSNSVRISSTIDTGAICLHVAESASKCLELLVCQWQLFSPETVTVTAKVPAQTATLRACSAILDPASPFPSLSTPQCSSLSDAICTSLTSCGLFASSREDDKIKAGAVLSCSNQGTIADDLVLEVLALSRIVSRAPAPALIRQALRGSLPLAAAEKAATLIATVTRSWSMQNEAIFESRQAREMQLDLVGAAYQWLLRGGEERDVDSLLSSIFDSILHLNTIVLASNPTFVQPWIASLASLLPIRYGAERSYGPLALQLVALAVTGGSAELCEISFGEVAASVVKSCAQLSFSSTMGAYSENILPHLSALSTLAGKGLLSSSHFCLLWQALPSTVDDAIATAARGGNAQCVKAQHDLSALRKAATATAT